MHTQAYSLKTKVHVQLSKVGLQIEQDWGCISTLVVIHWNKWRGRGHNILLDKNSYTPAQKSIFRTARSGTCSSQT